MTDKITVDRALLEQVLDWFQCHKDSSMSRNNSEQLADEVFNSLRATLEQPAVEPVAHAVVRPLQPDECERKVIVKWVGQPVSGPLYTAPQPPQPECNPHPDAPHGFDRTASHTEDRYVCRCEYWTPDGYKPTENEGSEP